MPPGVSTPSKRKRAALNVNRVITMPAVGEEEEEELASQSSSNDDAPNAPVTLKSRSRQATAAEQPRTLQPEIIIPRFAPKDVVVLTSDGEEEVVESAHVQQHDDSTPEPRPSKAPHATHVYAHGTAAAAAIGSDLIQQVEERVQAARNVSTESLLHKVKGIAKSMHELVFVEASARPEAAWTIQHFVPNSFEHRTFLHIQMTSTKFCQLYETAKIKEYQLQDIAWASVLTYYLQLQEKKIVSL